MWTLLLNIAVAAVITNVVVILIRRFFIKSPNVPDRFTVCEEAEPEIYGSDTDGEEDEEEPASIKNSDPKLSEKIDGKRGKKNPIEKDVDPLLANGGAGDFVQYLPIEGEEPQKAEDPEQFGPVGDAKPMPFDVFTESTTNRNDDVDASPSKKKKKKKKKAKKIDISGATSQLSNISTRKKIQMQRKPRKLGRKIRFEIPRTPLGKGALVKLTKILEKGKKLPEVTAAFWRRLGRTTEDGDEEIKKIPWIIWDYDPNTLPVEFVNKKRDSYLIEPNNQGNLCLLPKNILKRICSMLHPLDFVELSLTCRILHWKMFTFTTCYAPYTVRMELVDMEIHKGIERYKLAPIAFGNCSQEPRGLFVLQPKCLKKPFIFDTLELSMRMNSVMTDVALERVLPIRQFVNRLKVIYYVQFNGYKPKHLQEAGRLFEELNVTTFRIWFNSPNPGVHGLLSGADAQLMADMWSNVKAIHELDEVYIAYPRLFMTPLPHPLPLTNRIGIYGTPPDKEIRNAFENFTIGKNPCEFHAYVDLPHDHKFLQVIYAGFNGSTDISEYYSDHVGYFWLEEMITKNGKFTLKVYRKDDGKVTILFGRAKTFYKYQRQFHRLSRVAVRNPMEDDSDDEEEYPVNWDDDLMQDCCWKLETALEPLISDNFGKKAMN